MRLIHPKFWPNLKFFPGWDELGIPRNLFGVNDVSEISVKPKISLRGQNNN
jgi:hypothetical protein